MKLLITGGTGLLGSRLIQLLNSSYDITILSRKIRESTSRIRYIKWSPKNRTIDLDSLEDYDAILNLAGAGVADKRWTPSYKKTIIDSRVQSAQTLETYLKKGKSRPKIYVGASAVGYYGDQGEKVLVESHKCGSGFLAEVTEKWESAHKQIENLVDRSVILRIGIVLSTKGGALKEIMKPAQAGMYGYFGNGKAYYSWIHIDDMCRIIIEALENDQLQGICNATAPLPITIKELVRSVRTARKGKGMLLPVPEFSLKLMMGEMSQMLLNSTRVIPEKLSESNFKFDFENAVPAIKDLISKKI